MNYLKYTFILTKHRLNQVFFWISLLMYILFLTLPLYKQYYLGAPVPVYHFLIQTYLSASTSSILVMVACFPIANSIIQEKKSNFIHVSILRMNYKKYVLCQMLSNMLSCILLISIAYILSTVFISFYAPIDINDSSYHMQYVHSYVNANSLLEGNSYVFYATQLLLQICNSLFYLWITMFLSLLLTDPLVVGVLPLILYSTLKSFLPLIKIPAAVNPHFVLNPIHHLKELMPDLLNNNARIITYIVGYITVAGFLCFLFIVNIIKNKRMDDFKIRI